MPRNLRDYLPKDEEKSEGKKDEKADDVPAGEATKLHYLNCIDRMLSPPFNSDMTPLERSEMQLEKFCELVEYALDKIKSGH